VASKLIQQIMAFDESKIDSPYVKMIANLGSETQLTFLWDFAQSCLRIDINGINHGLDRFGLGQ